jgi:hypothetical protein
MTILNRADIKVRQDEDGVEYCLLADIDPAYRAAVRVYADSRLELLDVGGQEAVKLETLLAYCARVEPAPRVMG